MIKNNDEYRTKYREYMELLQMLQLIQLRHQDTKQARKVEDIQIKLLALESQLTAYKGQK